MAGCSFFLAEFSLFVIFPRYVKLERPSLLAMKHEILPLFIMFVPTAASLICRHIDKVMLGLMSTYEQLGLYDNVDKIYLMLIVLITTLGDVILPRMSNLIASKNHKQADVLFDYALRISIIVSCSFMFGISAIAPEFVPMFFGPEYMGSIKLLIWISPTIVMLSFSGVVRKGYLVPRYKNKVFVISMVAGALINIGFNLYFIPRHGAMGAVYGTLIAEFSVVLLQTLMTCKEVDYRPFIADVLAFSLIGATMLAVIRVLALLHQPYYVILPLEMILGALLFIGLGIAYLAVRKDAMYAYFQKKVTNRLNKGGKSHG
jgi:O-antigen/teichoic acid export membrane protein